MRSLNKTRDINESKAVVRREICSVVVLSVVAVLALASTAIPQTNPKGDALKQFVGVWQAQCNDKKVFLILSVDAKGSGLGGSISIGNMTGDVDGACEHVVDAPTPEHAQQIRDAQLQADGALIFKGATDANGKDNKFEMKLTGGNSANLKFFGTPVEANPWKLVKQTKAE